jgi:hypothetical protein
MMPAGSSAGATSVKLALSYLKIPHLQRVVALDQLHAYRPLFLQMRHTIFQLLGAGSEVGRWIVTCPSASFLFP